MASEKRKLSLVKHALGRSARQKIHYTMKFHLMMCVAICAVLTMSERRYPDEEPEIETREPPSMQEEANTTAHTEETEVMQCKDVADVLVAMKEVFKLVAVILGVLILACIIACSIRRCNCCITVAPEAPPPSSTFNTMSKKIKDQMSKEAAATDTVASPVPTKAESDQLSMAKSELVDGLESEDGTTV